jgi:hypothetical protein
MSTIKLGVKNTREQNKKVLEHTSWNSQEMIEMRESFKRQFGIDPSDQEKFPADRPGFFQSAKKKLREAESGSSHTAVLRAGVQSIVNNMYNSVATSFEDWCHITQSTRDSELYAPLHGLSFLREIGKQEKYPESRAAGLDIKLKNRKYGQMFPIEKELLDDDQTGQFAKQAGLMGEYAKLALEVIVMAKLASVAGAEYAGLEVPLSETQPADEASYPFSTAMVGGGANRPVAFGALTQANIQAAFIGLMNQKNKLGLKMMVRPSRLLISPVKQFDLSTLLNSAFWPSVPSGTAGSVGTNYAENPIKGIANMTVSRFMFKHDGTVDGTSTAWYLMDDSVPWFLLQVREAAQISQENPQSGESFDRDVIRFKLSLRANADHIDPRFCWQGNNGSV